jgi:hypothetical protein
MRRANASFFVKRSFMAALLSVLALFVYAAPQDEHRFDCTTTACGKIKTYLKRHYCGKSPEGNGPDDSCDIEFPKKPQKGVTVEADYHCEWNEAKQGSVCAQIGQPSESVRRILVDELRRLGLPENASGKIRFNILKSLDSGWSVAEAAYSNAAGENLELCEVIVLIDKDSKVSVLRKLSFQKTDIDAPMVTEWSVVDVADVEGTGQLDIVLEGDAYEDHWLEVVSLNNGSPQTVFSGLGYYL